jgi:acyl carrier protein
MLLTGDESLALIVKRLPSFGRLLRREARLGELGLDSLDQVEIMMVVKELFGIRLEIEDFKAERTVGELAERIAERSAEVLQP